MIISLGILLFSFLIISILFIPFIDFLYKMKLINVNKENRSVTPVGGGLLIVVSTLTISLFILWFVSYIGIPTTSLFDFDKQSNIVIFTFIFFALIGLHDDLVKIFKIKSPQLPGKPFLQAVASIISGSMIYFLLGIDFLHIPFIGTINLSYFSIIFFSIYIYFFARAFDATDVIDGMSSGVLLISLISLWVISISSLDSFTSLFMAVWIGGLIPFLYFNIHPARVWLGNSGSLSFGSTLAVISIILGKPIAALLIGGVFVIQALSLPMGSLTLLLEKRGWSKTKICMRAWIISVVLGILGIWIGQN